MCPVLCVSVRQTLSDKDATQRFRLISECTIKVHDKGVSDRYVNDTFIVQPRRMHEGLQ